VTSTCAASYSRPSRRRQKSATAGAQRVESARRRVVGLAGAQRVDDPLLERRRDAELRRVEVADGEVAHRGAGGAVGADLRGDLEDLRADERTGHARDRRTAGAHPVREVVASTRVAEAGAPGWAADGAARTGSGMGGAARGIGRTGVRGERGGGRRVEE
jgi:hypothetical protein